MPVARPVEWPAVSGTRSAQPLLVAQAQRVVLGVVAEGRDAVVAGLLVKADGLGLDFAQNLEKGEEQGKLA